MSDAVVVALVGVVGTGLVTWVGALTRRIRRLEAENRALWLWARSLVDHIYRRKPPPPPPAPESITDDD